MLSSPSGARRDRRSARCRSAVVRRRCVRRPDVPSGPSATTRSTSRCLLYRQTAALAQAGGRPMFAPRADRALGRTGAAGCARTNLRLERGDVDGLRALFTGLGIEGHLRALGQRLEAVGVDAGVVDEEVLTALVRGDEAEALVVVEPLHGSGCHVIPPRLCALRTRRMLVMATSAGAEHPWRRARRST